MFSNVSASPAEIALTRAGDTMVRHADVVMDRAFTVDGRLDTVWPWLLQLGKRRAGWYLPWKIERVLPPSRRAARVINPAWQNLRVGDVIPDYGGRNETFEVVEISAPTTLVYQSRRGRTVLTWSITLEQLNSGNRVDRTRVLLRLRLAPVRHKLLAKTVGELIDLLTVAGMAAGLRERSNDTASVTS
ncbi:MAG: hypothetical protein ACRDRN_11445 [Sciscionella sp.]